MNRPSASSTSPEPIRFYGRRKGKPLKVQRSRLLETLLPQLAIARPDCALDPRTLFSFAPDEVWLEIGFGGGEHLAAQADAHRSIGFIGSEVFLNGVAGACKEIAARGLQNVRLFHDDARFLLPALPAASLGRIFLLFPDPWPKLRHAKRRFINPSMLDQCARLLVDGGELRVASDHPVYVRWTLQHATVHPALTWTAIAPEDWRLRPPDGFATRYEHKAIAAGRPPAFLRFARISRLKAGA